MEHHKNVFNIFWSGSRFLLWLVQSKIPEPSLLLWIIIKFQSVQNIFILNLAASDCMMCILSLPITPITNVYKNWYFGNLLCHLIPCIQGIFSKTRSFLKWRFFFRYQHFRMHIQSRCDCFGSVYPCSKTTFYTTIPKRSISYYCSIVDPLFCCNSTLCVQYANDWIHSECRFFLGIQLLIQLVPSFQEERICGYFCTEKWESAKSRRAYTMIVMLAQFVVPFAVMAFCYANIVSVLSKRAQTKIRKMVERTSALESSCAFPSHGLEQYENEVVLLIFKLKIHIWFRSSWTNF